MILKNLCTSGSLSLEVSDTSRLAESMEVTVFSLFVCLLACLGYRLALHKDPPVTGSLPTFLLSHNGLDVFGRGKPKNNPTGVSG